MNIRGILKAGIAGAALSVLLAAGTAQAVPMAFFDRGAFDTATALLAQSEENFDGATAGDLIADGGSLGGFTFNYPTLAGFGVSMEVRADFLTTSGANYLGTDDAGVFQDGDDFNLTFAAANAIGMYFISADPIVDGDISITVGAFTADLDVDDLSVFDVGDGGLAYFLGIVDTMATFTSADIATSQTPLAAPDDINGLFVYNVDDIVVARAPQIPEPGTLALFGLGLLGLGLARRKRIV